MENDVQTPQINGGPGAVMVVGGGIAGIQASLDLANSGYKVYLIEEGPSIGGKMAQLDKTFPTNDCSMCTLSPRFIEMARNQNIEIITLADIESVEGEAGDFKVKVLKNPRFVDEDLCTGCGTCVQYCPVKIPDPYNENLGIHRCIYVPFPQAVPSSYLIDPKECVFLLRQECKICPPTCQTKAIDLYQTEKHLEIEVGAIILSPGYEKFDPNLKSEYGYGERENVVTSLEFERMMAASGPFKGEIKRPSDKKHPKKIAWLQCVGSRDEVSGNKYCSAVCCMYATKQLIIAKEHDPEVEATVFYNDIRAYGKGFEQYYERAKALPDVRYIWNMPVIAREVPETKNLIVRYCIDGEKVVEEEFDMVVLSVGLTSTPGTRALAEKMSIDLDCYGFCKTDAFSPAETSKSGIYAAGVFKGPMDIPESVMGASSAAALSSRLLTEHKGSLIQDKEYPPQRDVSGEEPRVGVFICHCGTNIAGVVSVNKVVKYAAKELDNVVHAEDTMFACSIDSAKHIADMIEEHRLNRVVVAACTPRTHEPVFQETLKEAGLNPFLFEMANIREHCSWVHMDDKKAATEKAKELVRMAVSKARLIRPLYRLSLPLNHTALVIGGGISGMSGALTLADQGYEVHLIEKEAALGGMARRIHYTLEGDDVQHYLESVINRVNQHPLIHVSIGTSVKQVSGYIGNFVTTVAGADGEKDIEHGVAIVATGAEEYRPTAYLYGENPGVLTQLELEEAIVNNDEKITAAQTIVMLNCVGSRDDQRPYCSRVCCAQAVKNALKIKEQNPETEIFIIHKDMRTYGLKEDYYRQASDQEVKFIRYDGETPQVEATTAEGKDVVRITVFDRLLGQPIELDADVLVLGAGIVPPPNNRALSQLLKVPLNADEFFMEAHMKLRPVEFATDGVFLCGLAHSPKTIGESISQAQAAASRAIVVLSKEEMEAGGQVSFVNPKKCVACGTCESVCPFKAITIDLEKRVAVVNEAICKGCGVCSASCRSGAIDIEVFSNTETLEMIRSI